MDMFERKTGWFLCATGALVLLMAQISAVWAAQNGPCQAVVTRNKTTNQYVGVTCKKNDCPVDCRTGTMTSVGKTYTTCFCDGAVPSVSCNIGMPTSDGYSSKCLKAVNCPGGSGHCKKQVTPAWPVDDNPGDDGVDPPPSNPNHEYHWCLCQ